MDQANIMTDPVEPMKRAVRLTDGDMRPNTIHLCSQAINSTLNDGNQGPQAHQQLADTRSKQCMTKALEYTPEDFNIAFLQSLEPEYNPGGSIWSDGADMHGVDRITNSETLPLDRSVLADLPENGQQITSTEEFIENTGIRPLSLLLQPVASSAFGTTIPSQFCQQVTTSVASQTQNPVQTALNPDTCTSKDERLSVNGSRLRNRNELRLLRQQLRPDSYYTHKRGTIEGSPEYLEHLDYVNKGAIEQPPNGENVKLNAQSCLTCIRYGIPCHGKSVVGGMCQCCRTMQKKQGRSCLWLRPEQKIWSYPDAQAANRIANLKRSAANTIAGIAGKKVQGIEHKELSDWKRKAANNIEQSKHDSEVDLTQARPSDEPLAKRKRNFQQQDSTNLEQRHNPDEICYSCDAEGLSCDQGLPCSNCVGIGEDFCTYINSGRTCSADNVHSMTHIMDNDLSLKTPSSTGAWIPQQVPPTKLVPPDCEPNFFQFYHLARQQVPQVQRALCIIANQLIVKGGLRNDPNSDREVFFREALVALRDMAQGQSLGAAVRISVPYEVIRLLDHMAQNNIGIWGVEVVSLAQSRAPLA